MSANRHQSPELPETIKVDHIGELTSCNHLLSDREALTKFWDEKGYWYFKDVLDRDVITELRHRWIDYLQRHGVIDQDVAVNQYNHVSFEGLDITPEELSRVQEFNDADLHKVLTENPKVNATMREILGDDPFWLPIAEYRANPPIDKPEKSRFIYPHQDGFYSRGLDMKICWIPVDVVEPEVGGCAWVEGAHRGPILHDLSNPPLFPIPNASLPVDGWKSATFNPGDIVIFDLNLPHSGLTNISKDKFRLSFDIRVTEASGRVPVIGSMQSLSETSVTVRDEKSGELKTFNVSPETYVRSTTGLKREGADIPTTFDPGETILINSLDGKNATLVRAIH